jgi:hypothetical protein
MTMRWTAAVAVLVAGLVHLWLWFDGFRAISVIGPLFMLNAVAGVVIAALVLLWRSWIPPLLAVGFGASTLAAFLVSATVGLFGVQEILLGTWQVVAGVAEIVAVVAGAAILLRERSGRRSARQPQDGFAVRRTDLD